MADTPLSGGGAPAPQQSSAPQPSPALQQSLDKPPAPPVVVKKYANRRLYNTETSSYITLENLAEMIRAGRDFVVYDAKSGDDITRGVLTQIIVEEESKGSAMLPTSFLRQLIGFYGGNLQGVVPRYLEHSMSSFARQQQQVRQMVERTFTPFLPTGMEEMSRQNMALFERAMSMWNPFHRDPDASTAAGETQSSQLAEPMVTGMLDDSHGELDRLRHEVESLRQQLAAARTTAFVAQPASVTEPRIAQPASVPEARVAQPASVPEAIVATPVLIAEPSSSPVPGVVPPNVVSDQPDAVQKPGRRPIRNKSSVES